MEGLRKEVMSLEVFTEMISKQDIPEQERRIAEVEGPNNHHKTFKVTYTDRSVEYLHLLPGMTAGPAQNPAHMLTMQDMNARYDHYPEMREIDNLDLDTGERLDLRVATRRQLYLKELFVSLSEGHEITPAMKRIPFVIGAISLRDNQGELIDSAALSQILRDEAFNKYAPKKEKLDNVISEWPVHQKRNYPKGGWKTLKENTMSRNIPNDSPVAEETEAEFVEGVTALVTPENVAKILVDRWRKLNDAAAKAEKVIVDKNITPESIRGKTAEEIIEMYGEDTYELLDSVVRSTPERLRLNEKVKAIVAGEKGGSWF